MTLNPDNYRSATAFRIAQLADPANAAIAAEVAAILRGQIEALCAEVERQSLLIARMDTARPGLSRAVWRELRAQGHPLFRVQEEARDGG